MAHRSAHNVRALTIELTDDITGVVYEISVITHAAGNPVRTDPAVERIVAVTAFSSVVVIIAIERVTAPTAVPYTTLFRSADEVRPVVARAVDRRAARQNLFLDVVLERMAHRSAHDVGALTIELTDDIIGV